MKMEIDKNRSNKNKKKIEEKYSLLSASFSLIEVIIIISISMLFGFVVGYIITYSKMDLRAKSDSSIGEIVNTYNTIKEEYYDTLDENKLKEAAISGMLKSLGDPYSNYMNQNITTSFNDLTEGEFVGIGASVLYENEYNKIVAINEGYPADRAGLKVGDIILKVDDKDCKDVFGDTLTNLIRGEKGTSVKITVLRDEKEIDFLVVRDTVNIQSVNGEVLENNTGYIKLNNFATNTYKQFKSELKKLEDKNIKSLIIDVRDNPGGQLQQTREILSMFFDKKTVLFQTQRKKKITKVKSLNNTVRDYPIVVLINNGSASASEVLATCFKENYKKAKIIGMESYGKGTIQKSENLTGGSSYKFTVEKWLTSKGKWIHGKGVKPDIEVEQVEEYYENPVHENDAILKRAIEELKDSN